MPTRTIVAPAAIASAKSLLMPIDSVPSPSAAASFASLSKNGRGGAPSGGMHISPSHRTDERAANARTSAGTSASAQPLFCGSSPTLTCTRQRCTTPSLSARAAISSSSDGESTEWISSATPTTYLTLFRCSGPMKCQRAPRTSRALSRSSCA